MCFGENNADHATSYLDSQLKSLWGIANACMLHKPRGKPTKDAERLSYILVEHFHGKHRPGTVPSNQDMFFHAQFSEPELDFLCNDDALLKITVKEGHYNVDTGRASDNASAKEANNRTIDNMSLTFRIPFELVAVADGRQSTQLIGTMVTLDYEKAVLAHADPELDSDAEAALKFYFATYFPLLRKANQHVLHFLPKLYGDSSEVLIDFSARRDALLDISSVHGVPIDQINKCIHTSWLEAAVQSDLKQDRPDNQLSTSLAEYDTRQGATFTKTPFWAQFGPPKIRALCDDEGILSFHAEDISFYSADSPSQKPVKTFSDWTVSVRADLEFDEKDGKVVGCKVNPEDSQLMPQFSELVGCGEDDFEYADTFTQFVSKDYQEILDNAGYLNIYRPDALIFDLGSGSISDIDDEPDALDEQVQPEWSSDGGAEIVRDSDMHGFDQITALSQRALDFHFRTLSTSTSPQDALLSHWQHEQGFTVDFKPLRVQLQSDGSVILSIHLLKGSFGPSSDSPPDSECESEIKDWVVAFAAGLKMFDLSALSLEWQSTFKTSCVARDCSKVEGIIFKHIALDFSNAKFLPERSAFGSLSKAESRRSIQRVNTAVVYLRDHYLQQLVDAGHHVLYTAPISPFAVPPYPTSVAFHVYTNTFVVEPSAPQQAIKSEPALVILGMHDGRRAPSPTLPYSVDWVARGHFGTSAFSSNAFLRQKLLPTLSQINAATTLLIGCFRVGKDTLRMPISKWSADPDRKAIPCLFKPKGESEDGRLLQYEWKWQDVHTYKHTGDDFIPNGAYSVTLDSKSALEIPTGYVSDEIMQIKLHGETVLHLHVELHEPTFTETNVTVRASWEMPFSARSEGDGIRLVAEKPQIVFCDDTSSETLLKERFPKVRPLDLLKDSFPKETELSGLRSQIDIAADVWQSCYPGMFAYAPTDPVFNRKGDLLLELRPHYTVTSILSNVPSDPSTDHFQGTGSQ